MRLNFEEYNFVSKSSKYISLLVVLIALLVGSAFYQGDTTLTSAGLRTVLRVVVIVGIAIVTFLRFTESTYIHKKDFKLLIIVIIYWGMIILNSIAKDFRLSVVYLLAFIILDDEEKRFAFSFFRQAIIVIAAFGVLFYLCHMLKLPIPYLSKPYYLEGSGGSYIQYGLILLYKSNVSSNFTLRLCGIFNEPGLLGTYMAFVLCADRLNIRKKENILLLAAGLCTFSVAFFVLIFVYLCFLLRKKPQVLVTIAIIFVSVFYVLPNIQFSNTNVEYLVKRFSMVNNRWLADNRSNAVLDTMVKNLLNSPRALFGMGGGYVDSVRIDNISTYKKFIVDYGIIGIFIMYVPIILHAFRRSLGNYYAIAFVFCFVINIYQRPSIYMLAVFIILFGGIEYIKQNEKRQE